MHAYKYGGRSVPIAAYLVGACAAFNEAIYFHLFCLVLCPSPCIRRRRLKMHVESERKELDSERKERARERVRGVSPERFVRSQVH